MLFLRLLKAIGSVSPLGLRASLAVGLGVGLVLAARAPVTPGTTRAAGSLARPAPAPGPGPQSAASPDSAPSPDSVPAADSAIRLVRSGADGIVVAFDLPDYAVETLTEDGQTYQVVRAPGLASSGQPGYPDLPATAVLLGIPPRGEPRIRTTVRETENWDQPVRLAPVARPADGAADGVLAPGGSPPAPGGTLLPRTTLHADPAAYASTHLYPSEPAAITEVGWIRNQRFVRLELRPFQYIAARGTLRAHPDMQVELSLLPSADPELAAGPQGTGHPGSSAVDAASDASLAAAGSPGSAFNTLSDATDKPDTAFDPVFDNVLLNAESARAWRVERPATSQTAGGVAPAGTDADQPAPNQQAPDQPTPSESQATWNIAVDGAGMVRVTGTDLALAGLPIGALDPRRLQLFEGGVPVAMQVTGEADGLFGAADALLFYGQPSPSRYSAVNVYQLAYLDTPGLRMVEEGGRPAGTAAPAAFTDTLRVEQDLLYRSDYPKRLGVASTGSDHWFWQQLSAPQAYDHAVTLPGVAPGAWTGRLRVAAVGKSAFPTVDPDHRLRLYAADSLLGEVAFDGNSEVAVMERPVDAARLAGGSVALRFEAPATESTMRDFYDQSYIDWFEIDYRRSFTAGAAGLRFSYGLAEPTDFAVGGLPSAEIAVYDVTDPTRVMRITGAEVGGAAPPFTVRFNVSLSGRRSFQVLPPAAYRPAVRIEARPKADLRAPELGADYLVIAPAALRAAIQPLADHRAGQGYRVAVVELQSIYDAFNGGVPAAEAIRDFIAYAYRNWPPPAPSHVLLVGDGTYDPRNRLGRSPPTLLPPFLKEADPWLGEVAVENAFATVSGDDLFPDLYLGRLPVNSAAETAVVVNKILNYETKPAAGDWRTRLLFSTDNPDNAGDFYAFSEDIADYHVPEGYDVERVYLGRTHADADAARAAIAARLGEGALVSQYIGHGLHTGWAQELMFRRSDVQDLKNGGRLPILLDMTCMTGFFSDPARFSISETAVRMQGGGAIAAFSPTGFGVATGHDIMNRTFIDLLLGQGASPIGAVVVASKLKLGEYSLQHRDLLDTFAFFGDPALRVPLAVIPEPTTTAQATVQAEPTETPTATPALDPTATPSPDATDAPSATPIATDPPPTAPVPPTDTPAATATNENTPKATPPDSFKTPTPTVPATSSPTPTPTDAATASPTPSASPTPLPSPTRTATTAPTRTATPGATNTPSRTVKPGRVAKRYLPLVLTQRPRRRN
jgi:hypothetical protein